MGTMILYDYFRSSAAFRVRIALRLKGLEAEHRYVHLLKGQQLEGTHREKSPQGFLPVLQDGPHTLTQSLAIVEYLDEMHPLPPLLPATPLDRAWVRAIALAIACDIHPLNNLRVLKHLKREFGVTDEARDAWYRHWIAEGFFAIEQLLRERPGRGAFCLSDAPTVADICLVPQVFNAQRFNCPMQGFPQITGVFEACMKLGAFDLAQPAKQPDAE
jgi:maleylpyruvate isomerase